MTQKPHGSELALAQKALAFLETWQLRVRKRRQDAATDLC